MITQILNIFFISSLNGNCTFIYHLQKFANQAWITKNFLALITRENINFALNALKNNFGQKRSTAHFALLFLKHLNASLSSPFASIRCVYLQLCGPGEDISNARDPLSPWNWKKHSWRGRTTTWRPSSLSHGGASVLLEWDARVLHTRAHAHDRNQAEDPGRSFRATTGGARRRDEERRRQLRERAPTGPRMGTLGSLGRESVAREKRVRKKMIGQDLRYKKRFVPLALLRPYDILSPGLRTHGDHGLEDRGGFCSWPRPELRTKRIRGSILLPWTNKLQRTCVHARCLWPAPHPLPLPSIHVGPFTYRFFHHYVPSTQGLLYTCLSFFFLFFFIRSVFSPTFTMWYVFYMWSYCRAVLRVLLWREMYSKGLSKRYKFTRIHVLMSLHAKLFSNMCSEKFFAI